MVTRHNEKKPRRLEGRGMDVASACVAESTDRVTRDIPEEELFRAQLYSMLSRLLAAAPDAALLAALGRISGDASELGQAFAALVHGAAAVSAADAAAEYHDLFIGIGRGELVPYGSNYLTGVLHEKPLAGLGDWLAGLAVGRVPCAKEPEDHIAALCEVMAGLIEGAFGDPAPLTVQRRVFERHIAPWAGRFFAELEAAQMANF